MGCFGPTALLQTFQRVLPDCLQHGKPWSLRHGWMGDEEALVDQRVDSSSDSGPILSAAFDDRLNGIEGAAADEYGQLAQSVLFIGLQQAVAPGNTIPHGSLARVHVSRSADQDVEPPFQSFQQTLWRLVLEMYSRQFDSQREAVQLSAYCSNGHGIGFPDLDPWMHSPGPSEKECRCGKTSESQGRDGEPNGRRDSKWGYGELMFSLEVKRLPAGDEHAELGA